MALERADVAGQLREAIAAGRYRVGDKLPSQRDLAALYGAAPNTVGEALRLLASEGLVRVKDRSGAVVQALDPVDAAGDPLAEARVALVEARAEVREMRGQLGELDQRLTTALDRLEERR